MKLKFWYPVCLWLFNGKITSVIDRQTKQWPKEKFEDTAAGLNRRTDNTMTKRKIWR